VGIEACALIGAENGGIGGAGKDENGDERQKQRGNHPNHMKCVQGSGLEHGDFDDPWRCPWGQSSDITNS